MFKPDNSFYLNGVILAFFCYENISYTKKNTV